MLKRTQLWGGLYVFPHSLELNIRGPVWPGRTQLLPWTLERGYPLLLSQPSLLPLRNYATLKKEKENVEHIPSSIPLQCAGRKALLIGIESSKAEGYGVLDGAHADVERMRDLLLDIYQYTPSQITILVDDGIEGHVQPTRANILAAIKDFVKDVKEGDKLCFHYSGYSTEIHNLSNSEDDDMDECLITMDGLEIVDDELSEALIKPLPSGSRLVAVLDTCHVPVRSRSAPFRCRTPVDIFLHNQELRAHALKEGVSSKPCDSRLEVCEQRICDSLLTVLLSCEAKREALLLEGARAQSFLDAVQNRVPPDC
ncbi:caspase domain-containing protein [Mycena haematopus]|nr:caspase domain-containing protein [Mycena haematopus]